MLIDQFCQFFKNTDQLDYFLQQILQQKVCQIGNQNMNTQSLLPQTNQQVEQGNSTLRVEQTISLKSLQVQNEDSITNCSQIIQGQKYRNLEYSNIQNRKEKQIIRSITFNKEGRTLFAGLDGQIHVQEFFNNRKLICKIKIFNFWCPIENLIYANKQILFKKGQNISVWIEDNANDWKFYQFLKGHTDYLNCVIINAQENLLISGGADQMIKFWERKKSIWSCFKTMFATIKVCSLTFNPSQSKLIVCGYWSDFEVIENYDSQWIKTLLIKGNEQFQKLRFISQNQHMFYYGNQFIQITKQEQSFCLDDCYAFSPCQYAKEKNLFIATAQNSIQIFRVNDKNNFILQQSIRIYGMDYVLPIDKGDWLASWNSINLNGISLRRIKQLD